MRGVSEARIVDRAGVVLGRTSDFAPTGNGFAVETQVRVPEAGADADADGKGGRARTSRATGSRRITTR